MSTPHFGKSYNYMCSYPDLESIDPDPESIAPSQNHFIAFDSFLTVERCSRRDSIKQFTNKNHKGILKVSVLFWFTLCVSLFTACIILQNNSLRCQTCQAPSALDSLIIMSYISASFFVINVVLYLINKMKNK
eukprot:NODE_645_length_5610_cov_0.174560.p2 type:complete len:133 gc:universal NODE_645_length_5610_cov_0.174560:4640-4242(-)